MSSKYNLKWLQSAIEYRRTLMMYGGGKWWDTNSSPGLPRYQLFIIMQAS